MKALVEPPTPAYMTGVAIGMGCGTLAILILLGMLTAEVRRGAAGLRGRSTRLRARRS